jgi:RimJ/RimL family protein N-acetyltransferase
MRRPAPWTRPDPLPGPLRTRRCLIRWYEGEDARALHEAVARGREALLPWLPWARHGHGSVEESRLTIAGFGRSRRDAAHPDYVMAIFERGGEALLGGTGLHCIRAATSEAEVGYWIRAGRQGQGLATEAVGALVAAAFGPWGFRRLRLTCAAGNHASRRVAEKLGFRLEGRERQARWVEDVGWDDHLTFGLLASERRGAP